MPQARPGRVLDEQRRSSPAALLAPSHHRVCGRPRCRARAPPEVGGRHGAARHGAPGRKNRWSSAWSRLACFSTDHQGETACQQGLLSICSNSAATSPAIPIPSTPNSVRPDPYTGCSTPTARRCGSSSVTTRAVPPSPTPAQPGLAQVREHRPDRQHRAGPAGARPHADVGPAGPHPATAAGGKEFTPRRIEALAPRVQQIADELLDAMLAGRNGRRTWWPPSPFHCP